MYSIVKPECYSSYFSLQNVDIKKVDLHYCRLVQWVHSKFKENDLDDSIILCEKFQRHTVFTFSYVISYNILLQSFILL